MDHEDTERYELESILPMLRKLDAHKAKPMVESFLGHDHPGVQVEAALIWLEAGEKKRSLEIIGQAFERSDYSNMSAGDLRTYVTILKKENSPEAWASLARLFAGVNLATISDYDNIPLCRSLEERGNPAGLKHYRRLLENRTAGIPNKVGWGRVVAHMFSDQLLDGYGPHDGQARRIGAETKSETEERLDAVKRWLEDRIKKLEQ